MKCTHIIFDLDNTLYDSAVPMDGGITDRMISAAADFFGVTKEEAQKLRIENLPKFSTTLEWLRHEGLTDTEKFLASVHPASEIDEVPYDKNLRALLESIDLPKSILTNSPREHAERVLQKLNVKDLFENITDIRDCNFNGKPYASAYRTALEKANCKIDNAIFLDDLKKYAQGFQLLGGVAICVGSKNGNGMQESTIQKFGFDADAASKNSGKLLQIKSVYELPGLLQNISVL